ncbi:MAG: signal peptidase I [Planctomycetota bacterium]|jgi:signal peptidase I
MAEVTVNIKSKRRIWVAIIFSLVMPGLGQVYCGKLARGLIFNFLNILPLPITIYLFSISCSPTLIPIALTLFFVAGIIQLIAIIDSACIAKRSRVGYKLKDYNRWYVYILFVLIVTGGSIGSTLYLRDQTLEAFRVPTTSCYPTIVPNDRLLANKSVYKTKDPARGDIVVFVCPEDRQWNWIKRVIAVAGDTVEIKDGQVYVNAEKLQRHKLDQSTLDNIRVEIKGVPLKGDVYEETNGDTKYKILLAESPHDKMSHDFEEATVPKHHCFVLGDNRNFSRDSRHFGHIPLATIKGRADYLYCPAKDWSRFGKISK